MSLVIPRLYISDAKHAHSEAWLRQHNITHIVNCAAEVPSPHAGIVKYLNLRMHDSPTEDIRHTLPSSKQFIHGAMTSSPNNNVLVHCYMGMSRSASIVVYYLMNRLVGPCEARYWYALRQLRKKHPIANPNRGYAKQLCESEPSYILPVPIVA